MLGENGRFIFVILTGIFLSHSSTWAGENSMAADEYSEPSESADGYLTPHDANFYSGLEVVGGVLGLTIVAPVGEAAYMDRKYQKWLISEYGRNHPNYQRQILELGGKIKRNRLLFGVGALTELGVFSDAFTRMVEASRNKRSGKPVAVKSPFFRSLFGGSSKQAADSKPEEPEVVEEVFPNPFDPLTEEAMYNEYEKEFPNNHLSAPAFEPTH